jgi:hypothetical protein
VAPAIGRAYDRAVVTDPEQRLARLIRHARLGWKRARHDSSARQRARRWLEAHPSGLPAADALWLDSLDGHGPLAAWLDSEDAPETWQHDIALHTLLACHPFTDLPQWSILST